MVQKMEVIMASLKQHDLEKQGQWKQEQQEYVQREVNKKKLFPNLTCKAFSNMWKKRMEMNYTLRDQKKVVISLTSQQLLI